jgi:hypothetical protein
VAESEQSKQVADAQKPGFGQRPNVADDAQAQQEELARSHGDRPQTRPQDDRVKRHMDRVREKDLAAAHQAERNS